jgi:hypothetical protein
MLQKLSVTCNRIAHVPTKFHLDDSTLAARVPAGTAGCHAKVRFSVLERRVLRVAKPRQPQSR